MLSARELHDRFVGGDLSALSIVQAHLDRIEALDGDIGAFLCVAREEALREARQQDNWSREERKGRSLAGVPIALKDNLVTRGMPTTAGSRILQGFMSPYTATAVERVQQAGGIVVGKTNLDEFAMGSSTEHSAFQQTRNPWDLERVPGGSSGGSAAAVAARMVPVALGSDTGGSIRQPAAYCGIVGMKPTYGRVSRYGLIAFASSLDQIGPMTRTVDDAGMVYDVVSGYDAHDATALQNISEPPSKAERPLKIGVPQEYFGEGMDEGVRSVVQQALERLAAMGHQLVNISLPHTEYAIATYYLIAPAEASSNLSRFDGIRYGFRADANDLLGLYESTRDLGFGAEVKRRILLGTHALSAGYYDEYYLTAQKVRTLIRNDFATAFESVDFVVTPTTPDKAFRFGERDDDPIKMYLGDIYTATANLAGIPGLSMPVGLSDGLPVGLQWLAPALHDAPLLDAAAAFEKALGAMPWPMGVR